MEQQQPTEDQITVRELFDTLRASLIKSDGPGALELKVKGAVVSVTFDSTPGDESEGTALFWMDSGGIECLAKGIVALGPYRTLMFMEQLQHAVAIAALRQMASGGNAIKSTDIHLGR